MNNDARFSCIHWNSKYLLTAVMLSYLHKQSKRKLHTDADENVVCFLL